MMENNYSSYEKWSTVSAVAALVALGILICLMAADVAILPLVIYAAVVVAAFFVADRAEKKRFPQWRKLRWKTPWIPVIVLLAVMVALEIFLPESQTKFIVFLCVLSLTCLTGPLQNTYFARKYHIDRFTSVNELLEAVPEVQDKIKKQKA